MKKIIIREERERKERKNRTILGIILVGIMVLSSAGYAIYNTEKDDIEKINYKGTEFNLKQDNLWHFTFENKEFSTFYNPEQTENIISDNLNLNKFYGGILYFSQDSDTEGINEIFKNIGMFFSRIQEACIEECKEDLPVKNCSDNIILIREASENLIKQEDNCVYILANKTETIKASDAFIFKFLQIQ